MKWLTHPIQSLKDWGVKKFALDITNKALDRYNVNVDRARAIVAQYANKLRLLLDFLDRRDKKLADGKLDEAEADALITDAKAIGTALTA
jgi:hypothetical protein